MSSDIDDNDMIQEGMVALLSACRSFDANKGMSFKNYLILCVENRYRTMLRACARQRAVPARNMLSLEDEADTAVDPTETSLSEMVETKDYIDSLHRILKDSLSDLGIGRELVKTFVICVKAVPDGRPLRCRVRHALHQVHPCF